MPITIRAMLFVSVAITISMISLLFLVETSIKNHFLDLDNETIDNKTIIIEQFSKHRCSSKNYQLGYNQS
ncbi:hypothetical protein [Aeromonas sp. Marseille-Q7275]